MVLFRRASPDNSSSKVYLNDQKLDRDLEDLYRCLHTMRSDL